MTLAGTYHTGWPTTEVTLVETDPIGLVAAGPRNAARLDDYATLDARVARKFQFDRAGSLTVFAEISNVIGRRNECCVEYEIEDEEGTGPVARPAYTGLSALTPSLGFVWRF